MSNEQQPLTRRALREAERASEHGFQQPEPPLTRKQLRERERAVEVASLEGQLPSTASPLLGQIAVEPVAFAAAPVDPVVQQSVANTWSSTDTGSIFTVSPVIGAEPTTNSTSIVIEQPRDPLDDITATTGSVVLPVVSDVVGSLTAEVTLIRDAQDADVARALEASGSFQADIPPVPAAGVIKGRSRERVFPKSVHTGRTQMYLVLSTIILIVAIAGLLGAGFMLGYFN